MHGIMVTLMGAFGVVGWLKYMCADIDAREYKRMYMEQKHRNHPNPKFFDY